MKVTFENATIADSVGKAARVAPTKAGAAFDKASGILMELDPSDNTVTLKATNLDVYYLEVVDAIEVEGEGIWRLPSMYLSQILAKLPIGSGKTVVLEQEGNEVRIRSGRTRAKLRLMDVTYFPEWKAYDPDKLEMVPDLGSRISQVEWAAEKDPNSDYCGIHIDGTHIVTTDRFRMAVVDCDSAAAVFRPITIPAGILKPVISNMRDVAVGIDEGMFLLMPDVSTQIKTVIYGKDFPPIKDLLLKPNAKWEWDQSAKIKKSAIMEIIERASIFAMRERVPQMTMYIGKSEVAVMCEDQEMGLLGDSITLEGQATHERIIIKFTPRNLSEAISNSPSEEFVLHYCTTQANIPVKIDGGSGYTAMVMPRRPQTDEGGG